MDHSEYREEILHGDHPQSYDHSEPHARSIAALSWFATVVGLALVGIAVQAYYDLIEQGSVRTGSVPGQLAASGPAE